MRILATQAQLQSDISVFAVCVSKLLEKTEFEHDDLTRAQYDHALANDIELDRVRAYSPVFSESTIDSAVPVSWPESIDEHGNPVTFRDYTQCFQVTGGWVARFCSAKKTANGGIKNPTWAEFKVWESLTGGFLTETEFQEIKTGSE